MRIDLRHVFFVLALPLGCNSNGSVFQTDVAELSRGAASWALSTAVDQGMAHLNAGYTQLASPFSGRTIAGAHAAPAQPSVPLQLLDYDDFTQYTLTIIKNSGETNLGQIIAVGTSNGNFVAGLEYWALKQAGLDDMDEALAIEIEGVAGDWDSPPTWPPSGSLPVFTNDIEVTWSSGAPGAGATVFRYGTSSYIAWVWGLSYSDGWSGDLMWYRTASSTPSSTDLVFGEGTFTLSVQTGGGSAPGGQNWYRAQCFPE